MTEAKDGASVPLLIQRNDHDVPLLAAWQYGLGRSAIFAADPDSLATIGWIHWNHYAEFWSQLVSWTMRQGQGGPFDLQVHSHPQRRPENPGRKLRRGQGRRPGSQD